MWLFLSLGTALMVGTADALAKKGMHRHSSETMAFVRPGWGALFLLPIFFLAPAPTDPQAFWKATFCALPFEIAAALALNTSIRISPLSLSIPYLAFTPVFLIGAGWIFLGEVPTAYGFGGIFCVTAGALLLQKQTIAGHTSSPFRLIPREKGPLLMLLTAFLFSITTVFAKKALQASSPFYFSGIYYSILGLGLLPFSLKSKNGLKELISEPLLFGTIGICEAAAFLMQMFAFMMAKAAYVISIKRLSLLLAVIYGWLFFEEKNILSRLAGATLMFAGAILLAFA